MDFTYADLCDLDDYFNGQSTLPMRILAIHQKLRAYFAEPTRNAPENDTPENASDGGPDAFYTDEDGEAPATLATPNQ